MSHSNLPEFNSSIPAHLLADLSDKDRYIVEQLSIMGQKSDWLVNATQEQSKELFIIKTETKLTNGKVAQAVKDIAEIQSKERAKIDDWLEVKQIVSIKQFIQKYLFNRYFLGVGFILALGLFKILTDEELRTFFFRIIGI